MKNINEKIVDILKKYENITVIIENTSVYSLAINEIVDEWDENDQDLASITGVIVVHYNLTNTTFLYEVCSVKNFIEKTLPKLKKEYKDLEVKEAYGDIDSEDVGSFGQISSGTDILSLFN